MSRSPRSTAREYLEALLVAGLFLAFANTWVLKTFYIPSSSMEGTLLVGDHLVVNRFIYGSGGERVRRLLPLRPVARGDIVVFRSPEGMELDLVKRCVAAPGDVVDFRDKRLFLNGQEVVEPYVVHRDPAIGGRTSFDAFRVRRDQFGPYRVPPAHYFCVGDNRDLSHDSRFWGPVPATLVKGRASAIYWSYGGEPPPTEWPGMARRIGQLARTAVGFFTRTRWSRTFEVPA
ncbi:MAG TPA: signal peptidase I [Thermoanaerobaculia bacterium]|nr:signal peptidase I [Thermoanaerobaculia bacterium]